MEGVNKYNRIQWDAREWYIKRVLWGGCGQIRWALGGERVHKMGLPSFPWEGVHKYDGLLGGDNVYKMGLPPFSWEGVHKYDGLLGGDNV